MATILAVDKDTLQLEVLSHLLRQEGHKVHSTAEPERGASVAITGHPEGGKLHIDYTSVTTYTSKMPLTANGTRVMIVDDAFAEGMSGGPVTDRDGRVVGIAIGIENNSKVGIVTPTSGLGELLAGKGDPLALAC